MAPRRIAIAAILILAAALRLHGIGRQSLWFDEAATVHIIGQPIERMIDLIKSDERTPPLHYFILRAWTGIFGDSEFSLRLPSAIAGVAAVGVLYLLIRRLIGFEAGAIAALMLAVSRYQIEYSQEARAYSLMVFLALWSCYLFVRLTDRPTPWLEAAYGVVTALLLWTHLYGVFAILAQHIAYYFWSPLPGGERVRVRGESFTDCTPSQVDQYGTSSPSPPPSPLRGEGVSLSVNRWLLLNLAVLALFGPWIPTAVTWTRYVNSSFWTPPLTPAEIARIYHLYAGSWTLLIMATLIAVVAVNRTRDRGAVALLVGLALLPVLVPAIVSALTRSTFTDRYAIYAPAGLFALAAAGIMTLSGKNFRVAYAVVICSSTLFGRAYHFEKPDWRSSGQYLTSSMRSTDVAVINRKNNRYLYDYYVKRPDIRLTGFDGPALPVTLPLPPGRHLWLIASSSAFPPSEMLARAPWQVLSHRAFGPSIEIFELTVDSAAMPASTAPTSATLPTTRSPSE